MSVNAGVAKGLLEFALIVDKGTAVNVSLRIFTPLSQ
jgi:hypothetical protein